MGCADSVLTQPLLQHTQMNGLLSDKDKQPYRDHPCANNAFA